MRSRRRTGTAAVVGLLLAWTLGCAPESPPPDFPGMELHARLEAHLEREKAALKPTLGHYGLVFPVAPSDLQGFMRQIHVHGEGDDLALGVEWDLEAHGGGVLRLLFDHWRPGSRAAVREDRFPFEAGRRPIELGRLYRAQRGQVFLPVPDRARAEIDGALPDEPRLPRMRLPFSLPGGFVRHLDRDAFKLLGLLIALEPDPARTWVNQLGQRLSVDLLLRHVREHYLATGDTPDEPEDHSELHLVELLVAYGRRGGPHRVDAVLERFLGAELAREEFDPEDESLLLAHHVESLGWLLEDPDLAWREEQKQRVKAWLARLEQRRFRDLAAEEPGPLSHLLKGLRSVRAHWRTLE